MSNLEKFMPKYRKEGKHGYYPVTSHEEWEELPKVYKAMSWFPMEMSRMNCLGKYVKEKSVVKNVVFDVPYMEPYGVAAKVSVHRENIQKILFCHFGRSDVLLYTVCEVEFENGERRYAEWRQDTRTGAYAIICGGTYIAKQGGFQGFVPARVVETEDGFEYNQDYRPDGATCHYEYSNPFRKETK